jgi:putative holliday junction resolvase
MRILSIDFGERRIGLAVSDELQMTARPLATIERVPKRKSFARIAQYVSELGVKSIIVGLPLKLDGTVGDAAARVEKFIAELREHLSCPITAWDERLTSYEAEERMRSAGLGFAERNNRVDEFAAMIILEDYLAANKQE